MVTFRNNNTGNRRSNFRRNDRNFKSNGDRQKFSSNFTNSDNFKRKSPGRNNHNAPKLIEKYNDLAREASSNGDKILSENYLQHADHFTRILNERETFKRDKYTDNKIREDVNVVEDKSDTTDEISKNSLAENIKSDPEIKKIQNLK
tara:strand:- start:466 stop:906 length:441 start_codon:yes stop_codon:yes gene_type:complete